MAEKNSAPSNRRTVLKSISGSIAGVAFVNSASAKSRGAKHSGFVYNPVTHEVLGEVSGQFNKTHDELRGNLRFDVPKEILNSLQLDQSRINMSKASRLGRTTVNGLEKTKYGITESPSGSTSPRYVKLSEVGDSIVGYVQHDGRKFAYSMVPHDRNRNSLEEFIERTGFSEKYLQESEQR